MSNFLSVANSNLVFLICAIPVAFVLWQSLLFIRLGLRRSKELELEGGTIKKVVTNSVVSSILPSLPIVISLAALMPSLGKFVPWLRLSVIGSAMYESMCADLALTTLGYSGLGDMSVTASAFVSVVWVMCVASIAWPLSNAIGLKLYDKRLKTAQRSGSGFMMPAAAALFVGLMAITSFARMFNFANMRSVVVYIVASTSALLLDFVAKKSKIKILAEFSFPFAMVLGMGSAIIAAAIL